MTLVQNSDISGELKSKEMLKQHNFLPFLRGLRGIKNGPNMSNYVGITDIAFSPKNQIIPINQSKEMWNKYAVLCFSTNFLNLLNMKKFIKQIFTQEKFS